MFPQTARRRQQIPLRRRLTFRHRARRLEGLPARPRYQWAVQFQPTSYDIAVWNGRGVQIQDSDLKEFVKTLQDPIYNLFL
jgi:hypothetical protein